MRDQRRDITDPIEMVPNTWGPGTDRPATPALAVTPYPDEWVEARLRLVRTANALLTLATLWLLAVAVPLAVIIWKAAL